MRPVIGSMWTSSRPGPRHDLYLALSEVWKFSAYKVFKETATIICHDAPPFDINIPCPSFSRGGRKIGPAKTLAWREKIRHWAEIVRNVPIGTPVLMTDIDLAFFDNPFKELFTPKFESFDVGICAKNTGAVYFSGSPASHSFMDWWLLETEELFRNPELYQALDKKWLGLDQCSFHLTTKVKKHGAKVLRLPYRFHSLGRHNELPAYLYHFHGLMRRGAVGTSPIEDIAKPLRPYCVGWQKMYKETQRGSDTG